MAAVPYYNHYPQALMHPVKCSACRFNSRVPALGGAFRLLITRLFRNALRGLSHTCSPGVA